MTDLRKLLDEATKGPWNADGDPWNRIVWSSAENRVCFMAHSNGANDQRDIATSDLIALSPQLAEALIVAGEGLKQIEVGSTCAASRGTVRAALAAVNKIMRE